MTASMQTDPPARIASAGWLACPALQRLLGALGGSAGEARIAGGAVRNALIGEPVNDVDIATIHHPEEVARRARAAGFAVHPTGLGHGTLTVVSHAKSDPQVFEVTTLRIDAETDGRHAVVVFTGDWARDAARRDFTINALYCNADGTVFDPLGGLADLATRTVRFCGQPEDRIREDYLRILRFFRFHASYGAGEPDPASLAAAVALRDGLARLSRERIRVEILKTLAAPGAADVIALMTRTGVLQAAAGGAPDAARLARLIGIEQANDLAPCAIRRLACLFGPDGTLAERLRLSNAEAAGLSRCWQAVSPDAGPDAAKALVYRLGADGFIDALACTWAAAGAPADDRHWAGLLAIARTWPVPRFPLTGADLVAAGLSPGPGIGALLGQIEDWWIARGFSDDEPALRAELARRVGKTGA